jgi:excinuclease ABC subunit A
VTEIYDYFRLLFARIGIPHCPKCGKEIRRQTVDEIADKVLAMPEGSKILINAPVVRGRKGEYVKEIEGFRKSGFARVEIDGKIYSLDEEIPRLEKNVKHNISVVVDRLVIKDGIEKRLNDSLETALKLADGLVVIEVIDGESTLYSTRYSCPDCGTSIEEIEPRLFSFNNPFGACRDCHGLGFQNEIDENLIVKDKNKTLREGAMNVSGWNLTEGAKMSELTFSSLAKHYNFSLDVPVKDLPPEIYNILLYGSGDEKIYMEYSTKTFNTSYSARWEGIIPNLKRRYRETTSD